MTFYEAAVEVLRRTGRPLHYKKITEIAVRENLLSHVGKTPHLTMSNRLEKEVQKDGQSVINQTRPGVFKLDEDRAKELTKKVRKKQKEREKRQKKKKTEEKNGHDHQRRRSRGSKNQESAKTRKKRKQTNKKKKKKKKQTDDQKQNGKKKRTRSDSSKDKPKRRRRRRRSTDDEDEGKSEADNRSKRSAKPTSTKVSAKTHLEEGPVRLKSIPRAAHKVLADRGNEPLSIDELADEIFEHKLVKFHTHDPVTTVKAALTNDNQIREERGHRPLFAHDDTDNWRLTEWDLSNEIHSKEQAVLSLTEEIRQAAIDQLGESLLGIQSEALEHLALTLLERLGYFNIKVSKRSSRGDVFFTADWRQGLADVRVCVRVVTDHERTLQEESVVDLRETLNHYSASEGVIIHLGDVSDNAVDKARIDSEAPITLLDRQTFVELLIKHGIGVKTYFSPIVTIDPDFVDVLAD